MSLPSRECGLKSWNWRGWHAGGSVTPLAGVWIEIVKSSESCAPSGVTPLAGVWIEIVEERIDRIIDGVTPLAGVWIEIQTAHKPVSANAKSLPSRECGLKFITHRKRL